MTASIQTVAADEADTRLDRFLRRRYPALTQGALQKLCRTGQIRVDGHRVEASARLLAGQAVRVPPMAAAPEKPAPTVTPGEHREMERLVLYRDEQVIVLNKPSGLATQGGPGITRHLDGMLDVLRGDGDRPRLVHRLDRDTSGVILLARTVAVAARLSGAVPLARGGEDLLGRRGGAPAAGGGADRPALEARGQRVRRAHRGG